MTATYNFSFIKDACVDVDFVDADVLIEKVYSGVSDSTSYREMVNLAITTADMMIAQEPNYSKVAVNLLNDKINLELVESGITSFTESIEHGHATKLVSDRTLAFAYKFNLSPEICASYTTKHFEYFGLQTVYDRYLLRDPVTQQIIESPQYFFMRVALGLSFTREDALNLYHLMATLSYLPSSPTLFNSGTTHTQMSSCFLMDSPQDDLEAIYKTYSDVARLSKFSGGIGVSFSRLRSEGSLIRGTNGKSFGIVPFIKTLDSSVAAVSQGSKRKGACAVYMETWHADIEDFLELKNQTGDPSRRTYNLNIANWVPSLFMHRVEKDMQWSLFDPADVPHFVDLYGVSFEEAYMEAEERGLAKKQLPARTLYAAMMRTIGETGNGWMCFKDHANLKSNQTGKSGRTIHSSNLCTEIEEVTSESETAVCNLGSINLAKLVTENKQFNHELLGTIVTSVVPSLDRVIDGNLYQIKEAKYSNNQWRPIGLGVMGLHDVFLKLGLPFESSEAKKLSTSIHETIYFYALRASCELAKKFGPHQTFYETKAANGLLQFDLWKEPASYMNYDWASLKTEIAQHGLRNSLLIAIAPTATIASIAGCYESIEPLVSNLFTRKTMSGDFIQINKYLVSHLRALGMWTDEIKNIIKQAEGSIQNINGLPDSIKVLYKTAWEMSQKSLIDMAAERGAYVDQSQSLNLFMEQPTIGKLSSMYSYLHDSGLKSSYYLRSRAATKLKQFTITDTAAVACSLENPEYCEACT